MKQQVLVIHGGDTFETYEAYLKDLEQTQMTLDRIRHRDWKQGLQAALGDQFEVLQPRFPNAQNARYAEWKIYMDKILPLLEDGIILVGHSMGGIFLAKYLSNNESPIRIKATMLVAAPYDDESQYSLTDFKVEGNLDGLVKQGGKIFVYQSQDDFVVSPAEVEKYKAALPDAKICIFSDRNHFIDPEFPEIVEDIRSVI